MRKIPFSAPAFDACTSKEDIAVAGAHPAGPAALTEAEMDEVAGGYTIIGEEKYGGWGGEW
jgi:hypothetical protein